MSDRTALLEAEVSLRIAQKRYDAYREECARSLRSGKGVNHDIMRIRMTTFRAQLDSALSVFRIESDIFTQNKTKQMRDKIMTSLKTQVKTAPTENDIKKTIALTKKVSRAQDHVATMDDVLDNVAPDADDPTEGSGAASDFDLLLAEVQAERCEQVLHAPLPGDRPLGGRVPVHDKKVA